MLFMCCGKGDTFRSGGHDTATIVPPMSGEPETAKNVADSGPGEGLSGGTVIGATVPVTWSTRLLLAHEVLPNFRTP